MKKLLKITVVLSLLLMVCVGTSFANRPYEGVTIRAMMEPHPTTTALIALVPEFEAQTGMRVILEEVPYEHLPSKALLNFVSQSTDYDIVHDDWLFSAYAYATAGYLHPLNSYVEDPVLNEGLDLDDFPETLITNMIIDGKLYGLPLYSDSTFLMYRKDVFEEYGVKVPTTMEEIEEAAKVLTRDGMYGITLRAKRGIHMIWTWSGFFVAYGGQYFDDNMLPTINSPEAIAATEYYVNLVKNYAPEGATNYGWEENRIAFEQGRAAMTIDASVNAGYAEDPEKSRVAGKVGYAVIPKARDYGINLSLHSLYISQYSQNKEAAFEFIKWATSKETQARALQIEPIPTSTSIHTWNLPEYAEKYSVFMDAHFESVEKGNLVYVPTLAETAEIYDTISVHIADAIAGTKTVEQALNDANDAVFRIMEEAGYYSN